MVAVTTRTSIAISAAIQPKTCRHLPSLRIRPHQSRMTLPTTTMPSFTRRSKSCATSPTASATRRKSSRNTWTTCSSRSIRSCFRLEKKNKRTTPTWIPSNLPLKKSRNNCFRSRQNSCNRYNTFCPTTWPVRRRVPVRAPFPLFRAQPCKRRET